MPYSSISELPDQVRNSLPKHAQEIFKEAFNSAYHDYHGKNEVRAFKIAWAVVKKTYRKQETGHWVRKPSKTRKAS